MPNIAEIFRISGQAIQRSIEEEGLRFDEDCINSLAICWAISSDDGIVYNRVTVDKYSGAPLIGLFANLTTMEENKSSNEYANRNNSDSPTS